MRQMLNISEKELTEQGMVEEQPTAMIFMTMRAGRWAL